VVMMVWVGLDFGWDMVLVLVLVGWDTMNPVASGHENYE